ncbi:MAG: amidohydrolase [Burkholderiales bacterium]|jgi:aminobenzoyl-glutamate utilization protein A|nr:amidohydrolase [Burkholderiales bacterium]
MDQYIKEKVALLTPVTIARRRDFHQHPEPGWTEFRTASIALSKVKELGYTITMGKDAVAPSAMMGVPSPDQLKKEQSRAIAQGGVEALIRQMEGGLTGFWADMDFGLPGPKLAIRVDMDSNDGHESQDEKHRPVREGFVSVNEGAMHTCGHDAHTAIGMAVAEIVAGMKDRLKGSIRLIFQPAEEGLRGAAPMVAAGVVKDVDAILGLHIGFQADKAGKIVCGSKGFLASTKWDVRFKGESAHAGAAPQEGKNALLAACAATLNLHAISRHGDGVTRINVGKLVGGAGRNVVPPDALLVMETRGVTSDLNDYMVKEAGRIVKAAAEMWDCEYSITVMGGTKSGQSSPEMIDRAIAAAKKVPFYTQIEGLKEFGAGEDFAHMMSEVQRQGGIGTYVQLGVNRTASHHNSAFDFDEEGLSPALAFVAHMVGDYLKID